MKTDSELRRDVERELEWEPSVDERRIGVSVIDGVVTLSGEVGSFAEKWNAERAVERVAGVRGIANELEVQSVSKRSDTDIAKAAADRLAWDVMVPEGKVTVEVSNGWVTLKGEVPWDYHRRAAERAVRNLDGVKGDHQPHHDPTARRADGREETDRRDLQAGCRARRPARHSGGYRPRGHFTRDGPLVDRTARG